MIFFFIFCFFLFTLSLFRLRQLSLTLCSLPASRWFWWGRATLAAAATLVVHEATPTHPCLQISPTVHSILPSSSSWFPTFPHLPLSWWTECPGARSNPNAVPALIALVHFFFFVVAFLLLLFFSLLFSFCFHFLYASRALLRRCCWISWAECSIGNMPHRDRRLSSLSLSLFFFLLNYETLYFLLWVFELATRTTLHDYSGNICCHVAAFRTLVKAFDFQDKHRLTHTHIHLLHSCQTSRTVLQFNWYTFTNTHTHAQHAHLHFPCIFFTSLSISTIALLTYIHSSVSVPMSSCLSSRMVSTPFCLFTISHWRQWAALRGERERVQSVPYVKCTINSRRARCPAQCMATLPRRWPAYLYACVRLCVCVCQATFTVMYVGQWWQLPWPNITLQIHTCEY